MLFNDFYHEKLLFLSGLVFFLIAHIFYILIYQQEAAENAKSNKNDDTAHQRLLTTPQEITLYLIYYGLLVTIMYILFPHLDDDLKGAVVAYALVLITMGKMTWLRFDTGQVTKENVLKVVLGAALFIISDLSIAIFTFVLNGRWYSEFIIMPTYCVG